MYFLSFLLSIGFVFSLADTKPHSEVLSFVTSIEIESDGKLVISKDITIEINDRQGDWITERYIWYNGKKNRVLSLNAEIIDKNGKVVKSLKKKDITNRSAIGRSSWYTDDFVKEFQLLHHEYPYQFKYSYTQKFDEYLEIDDWNPYLHYNVPTRYAKLDVTNNSDIELYIWESDSTISKNTISKNRTTWEFHNAPKIEKEINSAPAYELAPKVIIRPDHFSYGVTGSNESWVSLGDWELALQGNCNDLSISDQLAFKSLVADLDTDQEKIKAIYNKMQDEVRYIYVGVEYGGLQSYPASYVAENKYGDCKALTTYMQSALSTVGIESYRTTVYAGDNPIRVIDSLPSHQSNHVILCVPLEKDTVWLENTSNSVPYNYLGSFTQNRKALLMKSGSSQLVDLPAFNMETVKSSRSYQFKIVDDELQGNMKGQFRGEYYDDLLSLKYGVSDVERKNLMRKYYSHLSNYTIERTDRNQTHLVVKAEVTYSNRIKSYGPSRAIFLPKSEVLNLEKPKDRFSELRIRIPKNLTDSIYFDIDVTKYSQINLPKDTLVSIDSNSKFQYELNFSKEESRVLCIRKFQYPIHTFKTGEPYQAFFDFIDRIKNIERKTFITLKP